MKLPVGYGGVSKIGGDKRRRNPWRARVTDRWEYDEAKGRAVQKFRIIGYFPTKKAALQALAEFNKKPMAGGTADVTFSDVFELWKKRNEPTMRRSVFTNYCVSYRVSKPLHSMRMHDVRTEHLQAIMDRYEIGTASQKRLRTFWKMLFRIAMERDIVHKDYSEFVTVRGDDAPTSGRRAFTREEIRLLWENVEKMPALEAVLIMIYTGVRPSELLAIDAEHVHLSERWIEVHGTKTKAARRAVPIHPDIAPLIERRLAGGAPHLIGMPDDGRRVLYSHFLRRFWNDTIVNRLELEGLNPHCCRVTFVTLMVEAGANDRLMKKIVGHSAGDVTDVYTRPHLEALIREVDKVKI